MNKRLTIFYGMLIASLASSTVVGTGARDDTDNDLGYCHADMDCVAVYAGCGLLAINYRHLDKFKPTVGCTGSTIGHPNAQDGCSGQSCIINVPSHCVANQCALFDTRDIE